MGAAGMSALSTIGLLAVAGLLPLFVAGLGGIRPDWVSVVSSASVGALVAGVALLTGITGVPPAFVAPVVALGALFAVVATIPQATTGSRRTRTVSFAAVPTVIVFVPVVTITFASWYDPFATGIGYLDLGAALPVEVAAGAAGFAVLLLERRASVVPPRPQVWPVVLPLLGLWVAWGAWLAGMELAVDSATPVILTNLLLMPPAGAIAWAVVDRARLRSNSVAGVCLGALAGLAAAAPAAAFLVPLLAVVVALIVGGVCALLPRRRFPVAVPVLGALLIGGGASIILLGLLAKDVSFIYTGQPEVTFGQVFSVIIAGAGGFVVSFVSWGLLRRPVV